jgi:nitronate monooxygenase
MAWWRRASRRGTIAASSTPTRPTTSFGTLALTRLLVRSVDVPVIAAGGVMDGEGIAACLVLGASAAQLGTAFIGRPESDADAGYRAALFGEPSRHTRMTWMISGRPARCLANRFTALGADDGDVASYPIAYDAAKQLHAAARAKGEPGFGAQWAGQGAPLAHRIRSTRTSSSAIDATE